MHLAIRRYQVDPGSIDEIMRHEKRDSYPSNLVIKSATHERNSRGGEIGRPVLHQPDTYAVCELSGGS